MSQSVAAGGASQASPPRDLSPSVAPRDLSPSVAPRDLAKPVQSPPKTAAGRRAIAGLRPLLMVLGVAAITAGAAKLWLGTGGGFSTDDAYIRAAKLSVATDVSGIVQTIAVHEGQIVHRGDLLFSLDPAPFQNAVDSARAAMDGTGLRMEAEKRDYQRLLRQAAAHEAQVQSDEADLARFAGLVKTGGVTRAEYDQARFKLENDRQMAASLDVQSRVQLAKLANNPDIDVRTTPDYRDAAARLAEAQRQRDHSKILAPFDGIVTSVESLQPGQYLAAATAAFGLVSTSDVWVEAYPKETQLTWAKPGNHATITVDTYPGTHWDGVLESLSPASGSSFSVLPAQNASGNWVKVVQRIPIRIKLTMHPNDPPLRDGMSVNAHIDTGHIRSLRDLF
jgi:membrane fusion protein (multidrug efflux system)